MCDSYVYDKSCDNQLQVIPHNNGDDITLNNDYANPLKVRRHISDLKNVDVFATLEGQECQSQTNVDNDRYIVLDPEKSVTKGRRKSFKGNFEKRTQSTTKN